MTRARDVANLIGSGNYSSTTFTATAGQTAFTISHTQGFVQVFMNGLLLDETVDYTSNGSAVTLTSGAAAGDEIEVVAYNTFSVGDALNQAAADTRYVNTTGDTMTGNLKLKSTASTYEGLELMTPSGDGSGEFHIGVHQDGSSAGRGLQFRRGGSDGMDTLSVSIDASGHVTMPSQPFFFAKPTAGGDGQTRNPYKFENVIHNIGNGFVTSGTGAHERFVAPVAGNYYFATSPGYLQGGTNFGTRLAINGGHYAELSRFIQGSAASHAAFGASIIVRLSANDYVTLIPQYTPYHLNTNTNYFCGMLIG